MDRCGEVGFSKATQARRGAGSFGQAARGKAGKVGLGAVCSRSVWLGIAGSARRGQARSGKAY
jgi:hypothetical protein